MNTIFQCGARTLDVSAPVVMGVLNVTPDSFSDGGCFTQRDAALKHALQMVADGARIIDVGGESTRPGAAPVSEQQELDRVIPVIEAIGSECDAIISVDTSTAVVIEESAKRGAGIINDVRALSRPGSLQAAAASGLPVCLMHMQGEPGTMQQSPHYDDVVAEVIAYLRARMNAAIEAGMSASNLWVDPGFGFGKTDAHNLALLAGLSELVTSLQVPVLAGLSRKSIIGRLLDREVDERLAGSLSLALMAVERGASIIRAHDVKETVDAITLWSALQSQKNK